MEKDFASGGKWENKASGERQKQERGRGEHERKKRQEGRKEEKRRRARWRDKERDEDEGFERKTGGKRSLRAKLGLLRSFLLSLYALHISPPPSYLSTLKISARRLRGPVRQIFFIFPNVATRRLPPPSYSKSNKFRGSLDINLRSRGRGRGLSANSNPLLLYPPLPGSFGRRPQGLTDVEGYMPS